MISYLKSFFCDLHSFVLPDHCPGCKRTLRSGEKIMCLHCRSSLHQPSSLTMEAFRNKFNIEIDFLYAHWKFIQYGKAQQIIHAMKYGNSPFLARRLGREIAVNLPDHLNGLLVPVPQHPFRRYRRGFNQAAELARGIAENSGLKMVEGLIQRSGNRHSQTTRSRMDRLQALEDSVYTGRTINSSHYYLTDDVVTTGSTLQTCATMLQHKYPDSRIGLIVVATV